MDNNLTFLISSNLVKNLDSTHILSENLPDGLLNNKSDIKRGITFEY